MTLTFAFWHREQRFLCWIYDKDESIRPWPLTLGYNFWAHLCPCTMGSYGSPSVCPSVRLCKLTRTKVTRKNVTRKKVTRKKNISQQPLNLGSWNLVSTWTWMTPNLIFRVKVIGQRSRSRGRKKRFRSHSTIFEVKGHMGQGQRSHGSRSKVNLEGQGHQVKMWFQVSIDRLTGNIQGHGSGSKVTWVKVKGQVG